jgi:hypothetical protein
LPSPYGMSIMRALPEWWMILHVPMKDLPKQGGKN